MFASLAHFASPLVNKYLPLLPGLCQLGLCGCFSSKVCGSPSVFPRVVSAAVQMTWQGKLFCPCIAQDSIGRSWDLKDEQIQEICVTACEFLCSPHLLLISLFSPPLGCHVPFVKAAGTAMRGIFLTLQ